MMPSLQRTGGSVSGNDQTGNDQSGNDQAISDRDAIRELLARYCHLLDARRIDAWSELFTADCVLDLAGMRRFEGREGVLEFAAGLPAPEGPSPSRHCIVNEIVEVDGDHATAECYLILLTLQPQLALGATGRYVDRLRRENGQWRFEERVIHLERATS
jgi:3-phenylpropionate/cinnamic acid dioxygenase small subunit